MIKRRSLVVYYKQKSVLDKLKDVHICYTSEKNNYSIIYVDNSKFDEIVLDLKNNPLVNDVVEQEKAFEI